MTTEKPDYLTDDQWEQITESEAFLDNLDLREYDADEMEPSEIDDHDNPAANETTDVESEEAREDVEKSAGADTADTDAVTADTEAVIDNV